jgi:hypothetical protein
MVEPVQDLAEFGPLLDDLEEAELESISDAVCSSGQQVKRGLGIKLLVVRLQQS